MLLPRPFKLSRGFGLVRPWRLPSGEAISALQVGGVFQGATYHGERRMEPVFEYIRGFDACFELRPGTRNALMIGGGAYSWPRHVAATRPGVHVDVVELEPGITKAARRYFYLDEAMSAHPGALTPIEGDGRAYVESRAEKATLSGASVALDKSAGCEAGARRDARTAPAVNAPCGTNAPHGETATHKGDADTSAPRDTNVAACESMTRREATPYDAIVLDAFAGTEPVLSLATAEFFESCRGVLAPEGLLLANVVSNEGGDDVSFLRSYVATATAVFSHVAMRLVEGDPLAAEDNYLVVASNEPFKLEGAVSYGSEFLGPVMHDEA